MIIAIGRDLFFLVTEILFVLICGFPAYADAGLFDQ